MPFSTTPVLDEATSSLSEENEAYFYTTLRQLNITVLTVGHRSTLQKVYTPVFIYPLQKFNHVIIMYPHTYLVYVTLETKSFWSMI